MLRDPDPSFHFDVDLDQTYYFDADPDLDPVLHQSDAKLRPTDPPRGSILRLYASIESVYGPLWLHFEPPQLTNFDFDSESDPLHCFVTTFFL